MEKKYIIKSSFKDIYTNKKYKVNDVEVFTDERAKEIKAVEKVKKITLIEEVVEEKESTTKVEENKETVEEVESTVETDTETKKKSKK